MRIQLSKNFYLDEFTRSQTAVRHGIEINVDEDSIEFANLRRLVNYILQPVRDELGAVHISSGLRPTKLNSLIRGSKNSDHITGSAADFTVANYSPYEVAIWIRDNVPRYKQLIHEFGRWVHVSVPPAMSQPRCQDLTAIKIPRLYRKPKTVYVPRILTIEQATRRAT